FAPVRRRAVCDPAPGARTRPCAHPWSPYVSGSRGGAYVRACSVDRSASRSMFSAGCVLGEEGVTLYSRQTHSFGPACDFARLIREGLLSVNVAAPAAPAGSNSLTRR